tara:strand:+ start:7023 stop:7262 length:240 start_codon:yes stop_codon:yes gene_type:complete
VFKSLKLGAKIILFCELNNHLTGSLSRVLFLFFDQRKQQRTNTPQQKAKKTGLLKKPIIQNPATIQLSKTMSKVCRWFF